MEERKRERSPVVVIGASAGGLAALRAFLAALPADPGCAFLVVQHLSPDRPSHMADILSKDTPMPVRAATDGEPILPDHVFLAPPGTYLEIQGDSMRVREADPVERPSRPIDRLFRSAANDRGDAAVGIILSGSGSDGTDGAAAIHGVAGLVFAQDPDSAEFPEMPHHAVAKGSVDIVLPPDEIARRLLSHMAGDSGSAASEGRDEGGEDAVRRITAMVTKRSGIDFGRYRSSTVERRIERRRILSGVEGVEEYAERLAEDPAEQDALAEDLLIHVTHFFRDPSMFEALAEHVWPAAIQGKSPEDSIRVWVPGCSTGQEVYSIAMTLVEYLERHKVDVGIQIFGTDASDDVLEAARRAIYQADIEKEIDAKRLARFFDRFEGSYRIKSSLRDLCVFARHDVTSDPPFLRLDLISCRNLLIYLSPDLQKRVISIFHYALGPEGRLVLGRSETVGEAMGDSPLFRSVEKKLRIYAKRPSATRVPGFQAGPPAVGRAPVIGPATRKAPTEGDVRREADRLVSSDYGPPGVVVDESFVIVQFRGDTRPFLQMPTGAARFVLLEMAPDILAVDIRAAVEEARDEGRVATRKGIRFRIGREVRETDLRVVPLRTTGQGPGHFLLLFEESKAAGATSKDGGEEATGAVADPGENELLRRELAATKTSMQAVVDGQEATNRELREAVEEAVSANEELQSTNEELESAKEELQAMNEEVTTLNEELRNQNQELKALKGYAETIVDTIRHPLVVMNEDRVVSANRAFLLLFESDEQEVAGRPLRRVAGGRLDLPPVRALLQDALASEPPGESIEVPVDVPGKGRRTIAMDARPVRDPGGKPQLLLVLEDITDRVLAAKAERRAERLKGAVAEAESFGYTVSHDLRTPLRAIAGLSEGLLRHAESLEADDKKAVQAIHACAERLSRTVDGILHLTRVQRSPVQRERLDASALFRSLFAEQAAAEERRVEVQVDPGLHMQADPAMLEALLSNLISNALKFTRSVKRPVVGFHRVTTKEGPAYVVEDNGIGFPSAEAERLFQPFQRLHDPSEYEGSGIGLATVRRVAERHGGKAWAEGSPKRGAKIFFTLGERPNGEAPATVAPPLAEEP